jgi:hypothetical protein
LLLALLLVVLRMRMRMWSGTGEDGWIGGRWGSRSESLFYISKQTLNGSNDGIVPRRMIVYSQVQIKSESVWKQCLRLSMGMVGCDESE